MTLLLRTSALLLILGVCGARQAAATTLTFDDITALPGYGPITDGYGGFDWNVVNQMGWVHQSFGVGFPNATVSGDYTAFTYGGAPVEISRATAFDFNSASFGAAGRNNMNFTLTGYFGATELYTATFLVPIIGGPTFQVFDWQGIDRLRFEASGGTPYYNDGFQVAMDNFTFDEAMQPAPVPEPGSLVLLGSGLAAIAARLYRGRRRA